MDQRSGRNRKERRDPRTCREPDPAADEFLGCEVKFTTEARRTRRRPPPFVVPAKAGTHFCNGYRLRRYDEGESTSLLCALCVSIVFIVNCFSNPRRSCNADFHYAGPL